ERLSPVPLVVSERSGYSSLRSGRWMGMSVAKILWVSSTTEPGLQDLLEGIDAISVEAVSSAHECCSAVRGSTYCVVVANFPLPDCTPDELFAEIKRTDPALPVVIRDGAGTLADAVRLTKAGADDYFGTDFAVDSLLRHIEVGRELGRSRELEAL